MLLTVRYCPKKKLYLCEWGKELLGWGNSENRAWKMGNRNYQLMLIDLAG